MLEEREEERREEIDRFPADPVEEDGNGGTDIASPCPILDGVFRDGGAAAVTRLTNFSSRVEYFVVFRARTPTFIKTITGFIEVVASKLYEEWAASQADESNMRALVTSGHTFTDFPCAMYATDVTFQQTNRPAGNMEEVMAFYSAKHKLYGFNVEMSVSPRGLAINCTRHARGNTADITLFRDNQAFHQTQRQKADGDQCLQDHGPLNMEYLEEWAVLADKGYQGLADHVRCIHPKKGNSLTSEEQLQSCRISSDRVIVENYFGRLGSLWRICVEKYRWSESLHDDIFQVCAALTNYYVTMHPLRDENGMTYHQYQNWLLSIGQDMRRKRRQSQEKYRRKQRLRHLMELDDHPVHDSHDSFSDDFSDADSDMTHMSGQDRD